MMLWLHVADDLTEHPATERLGISSFVGEPAWFSHPKPHICANVRGYHTGPLSRRPTSARAALMLV